MRSGLDSSHLPGEGSAGPLSHPASRNPERDNAMPFTLLSDDELIARLLIHTWTLTTGKTLRCDVPPHELTEEELIDFWTDEEHFD
jgi:hypothetical protein